jgi:uncharacterized protein YndB with AHSA1/START domain
MTERSITHGSFTIDRMFPAKPDRVFRAWSDKEQKAKWFPVGDIFDFRVGGREYQSGEGPNGASFVFDVRYHDIVPDQRIIYAYEMLMDGRRISVSVATVELVPQGESTRVIVTEHGAFLDGLDNSRQREEGTKQLMEALAALFSN